jgi:uncharacterized membrane protein YdfJ with MMPL/SSD domain
VRRAIPDIAGATTYVSGFPAINHDTQKIYNSDLSKGESIAIPIALIVLAFMFGTLAAIGVPLAFAAVSIPTTIGIVWIFAHYLDMAVYVTNIVSLIGFAIAIDYSMLVVYRFGRSFETHESAQDALIMTMRTAGRATLFSGGTVAIGLALLVFMPLPFMRSMGSAACWSRCLDRRLGDLPARAALHPRAQDQPLPGDPKEPAAKRAEGHTASGPGSRARSCAARSPTSSGRPA